MSIWFGPKGKAYTGTGENSWLKRYVEHLTGKNTEELIAHYSGTAFRHRAEDITYDETRTVKTALLEEREARNKGEEVLQNVITETMQQEREERAVADEALLARLQDFNIQNGVGAGSLKSLHSPKETGLDGVQLGNECHAKGDYSNAQNYGTIAEGGCQSVRGRFNTPDAKETYADIVGNGVRDEERSNAYTLDWNGNGWFLGDVTVGKEKKALITKAETEQKMQVYQKRIESLEETLSGFKKSVTISADAGERYSYTVPAGFKLKSFESVVLEQEGDIYLGLSETQHLELALFDEDDNSLFSGKIEEGTTAINVNYPFDGEYYLGKGFWFEIFIYDSETDTTTEFGSGTHSAALNFTLETLTTERFDDLENEVKHKVAKDTIVTEVAEDTLILEENQDARLGETESLALSLPEHIGDHYRSAFSFQSGEKATSLAYGYAPLNWKGDDVTSDGRFVPEPFSIYEADVKNLGVNGIRARVDKIAGYASVDVEGTVLSLPDSAGKALRDYKIYGNSVQDGEPSAESPVAIQSVGNYNEETGLYDVPVTVHGKNLIPYPYTDTTKTVNGITFRDNGDGSVTISGTATANATFKVFSSVTDIPKGIIHDKQYVLSLGCSEETVGEVTLVANYFPQGSQVGSSYKAWISTKVAETKTDIIPDNAQGMYWYLIVYSGRTVNVTVYPQVELGNTATEYQPYIEPKTTIISLWEPLRKMGDVADYIDFKNSCVVQQVEVFDDTGAYSIEESYAVMDEPVFWLYEPPFPAIKTNLYDNVITVDTEIQPSNVKATYFKKER